MKSKMFKGITLSLIAASFASCNQKNQDDVVTEDVDIAKIRTEIQTLESGFADKMNAHKSDDIVYYADDATSYGQNKKAYAGREAIYKGMKEEADMMPKGATVAYETHDLFPSGDGNQVVELGGYKVSDSTDTVLASGNYMALFVKKDGKYECIRDMSASNMAKPEPAPMAMPAKKK